MTDPAPSVWGTFKARDAHAVKDFLVALGFRPTVVYEDGEGGIAHAQLDWPEGGGVMFGSHQTGAEWSLEPGTAGFYVVTGDVAAVHERARQLGAEIFRPLQRTDYDSEEFSLRDPEGNLWSFGDYPGESAGDA